jgi:hypothetical protein
MRHSLLVANVVPAVTWVDRMEGLSDIGHTIAGAVVGTVAPEVTRFAQSEADCFGQLTNTLEIYKARPNADSLQGIQAMVNCLDLNSEQVEELHLEHAYSINIYAGVNAQVWEVLRLLDQDVDDIAALVPLQPGVTPIMDPDRIKARTARAQGFKASDIRDRYNEIAGEKAFAPLP